VTGPGRAAEAAVDHWVAAWNEADPEARRAALEAAAGEGCVFVGPTGTVAGREALHAAIAEARDFMPGAVVVRQGPVRPGPAGELTFAWAVRSADGAAVLAGVDALELDGDGRLARVVVLPASS